MSINHLSFLLKAKEICKKIKEIFLLQRFRFITNIKLKPLIWLQCFPCATASWYVGSILRYLPTCLPVHSLSIYCTEAMMRYSLLKTFWPLKTNKKTGTCKHLSPLTNCYNHICFFRGMLMK